MNALLLAIVALVIVSVVSWPIKRLLTKRVARIRFVMTDAHAVRADLSPVRTLIWHGEGSQTDIGAGIFNDGAHPILNVRAEVQFPDGRVKHRFDEGRLEAASFTTRQWSKEPEDEATTFEYSPRRWFKLFMTVTFLDVLGNEWKTMSDRGAPCVLVKTKWTTLPFLWSVLRDQVAGFTGAESQDPPDASSPGQLWR